MLTKDTLTLGTKFTYKFHSCVYTIINKKPTVVILWFDKNKPMFITDFIINENGFLIKNNRLPLFFPMNYIAFINCTLTDETAK